MSFATCPLWQGKALVLLQQVVPALHDDEHVVDPDANGDEGEDVVSLVVFHPKHEHDSKSRSKTKNTREHSSRGKVKTNLSKDGKKGREVIFLPPSCSAYPTSSL